MFIIWDPFMGGWLAVFILFDFPIMLIHRLYTRAKARKEQERIGMKRERKCKRNDYIAKYIFSHNINIFIHDDELKACVDEMLLQMPPELAFFPDENPYSEFQEGLEHIMRQPFYRYEEIRDQYIDEYIIEHNLYLDDGEDALRTHAKEMQLHHPDNIMPFSYDVWYRSLRSRFIMCDRMFRNVK